MTMDKKQMDLFSQDKTRLCRKEKTENYAMKRKDQ